MRSRSFKSYPVASKLDSPFFALMPSIAGWVSYSSWCYGVVGYILEHEFCLLDFDLCPVRVPRTRERVFQIPQW